VCVGDRKQHSKGEILHYIQSSIEAVMNSEVLCIAWHIPSEMVFNFYEIEMLRHKYFYDY